MNAKTKFRPLTLLGSCLCLCAALIGGWIVLVAVPAMNQAEHDAERLAGVLAGQEQRIIDDVRTLLSSLANDPAVVAGDRATCDGALRRAHARFPELVNIVKAGPDGQTFCSAAELSTTVAYAREPAFREALESKALTVSAFRTGTVTGREQLTIAYPVVDDRTAKVGFVLRSGLDVDWLRQRLHTISIPSGFSVALTDRIGTIIASEPHDAAIGRPFANFDRLGTGASGPPAQGPDDRRNIVGVARFGPGGNGGAVIASQTAPPPYAALAACALGLLAAGIVSLMSARRQPHSSYAFMQLLIVGAVVLAGLGGACLIALQGRATSERAWIAHSHALLDSLHRLRTAIVEAETGERGFLLTENALYLKPYFMGTRALADELARFTALSQDNPRQRDFVKELATAVTRRMAILRDTVDKVRNGRNAEALANLREGTGFALMEKIRVLIDRMEFEEQALQVDRQGRDSTTAQRMSLLAAASLGTAFLALLSAAFSLSRDRRAREARETAMRETNRQLLLAEEVGRLGHWRATLPELKVDWSDGVYRLHGLDKATFQPSYEATVSLCHPDDRPRAAQAFAEAVASGEPFAFEGRMIRADGSIGHVAVRGCSERDHKGAVRSLFGVYQDVSEIVETTHRLREQEARYRLLAEATTDMIVMGYIGERRSFFSPSVETMLGYSVEAALDLRMAELLHPDEIREVFAQIAALSESQPKTTLTCRFRHADGSWIWGEAALRYVAEMGGKPALIASVRDVTARKQAESDLRLVKEAAELARAQAETANQAKTEFLAAMSHEIRTPLNAIIGFAELLASSGRLPDDLQRHAELVRTSGLALLGLVNDILDFSKVEAGAIEIERRPFAPLALLDNCLSMVRGSAVSKGIELGLVVDESLPRGLLGDEARLRQVLLNLLNNAVKFTHSGMVTLTARHDGPSTRGERIRFSVQDTGIGIAKDKQHRLFQRFSQADGSTAREYGGTGLGLAICKRLVELMGGEIAVLSDEGHGATFWFSLTLPRATLEPTLACAETAHPASRRGALLLVEDVAINQELGRLVLEAAGHTVTIAADGAAAVAAVERERFDLVLMDVQMPGMDGLTATRLIRELPEPSGSVPIIAMTANVLPEQVREFLGAGMNGHIAKPFNRAELYAVIDHCLEDAAQREIAAADAAPTTETFDRATFDELAAVLGAARMPALLDELAQQLRASLHGEAAIRSDRERCKRDAHVLVSAGGMLGFQDLAEHCRALDRAPLDDDAEFTLRLEQARRARSAALAEIDRRRQAGPMASAA